MRTVEQIEADLAAARQLVVRLEIERDAARLRGCPISVGDLVRNRKWKPDRRCVVAHLDPWGGGNGSVRGHPLKKDGTPAKTLVYVGMISETEKIEE